MFSVVKSVGLSNQNYANKATGEMGGNIQKVFNECKKALYRIDSMIKTCENVSNDSRAFSV